MKFDQPAGQNPIDQMKVIGKPIDRIDGPLKTCGLARYAYERHDVVAIDLPGFGRSAPMPAGAEPSATTVPLTSSPGHAGAPAEDGYLPSRCATSARFTPAAATSMITS